MTFSEIAGGVRDDNGTYIARLRIRFIFLIILFIIMLSLLFIFERIANAGEIVEMPTTTMQSESYVPDIQTTEETSQEQESVSNFYISIPGITSITVTKDNRSYDFTNPSDNQCSLQYEIYTQEGMLYQTKYIKPGYCETVPIYEITSGKSCNTEIIVRAQSIDGSTEYNSVKQNTQVTVQ